MLILFRIWNTKDFSHGKNQRAADERVRLSGLSHEAEACWGPRGSEQDETAAVPQINEVKGATTARSPIKQPGNLNANPVQEKTQQNVGRGPLFLQWNMKTKIIFFMALAALFASGCSRRPSLWNDPYALAEGESLAGLQAQAEADPPNLLAQGKLANHFLDFQNSTPEDYTNAAKYAQMAASRGDLAGLTVLGLLARDGAGGIPQDTGRAMTLLGSAAEKGYPPAILALGHSYFKGHGVPQDRRQGVKYYKLAAELGYGEAYRTLAGIYADLDSQFGTRNYLAAVWWLRRGVKLNWGDAFIYIEGIETVFVAAALYMAYRLFKWFNRRPQPT